MYKPKSKTPCAPSFDTDDQPDEVKAGSRFCPQCGLFTYVCTRAEGKKKRICRECGFLAGSPLKKKEFRTWD